MHSPKLYPRRRFLKMLAGATALLSPGLAFSATRYERNQGHIKGVGLTTYSLRQQMRHVRGKPGNGDMDILGFLDYCAENGIETAELTSYYFPPDVERSYLHEVRRRAHLLGIDLAAGAIGNNFTHAPGSDEAREQLEYVRTWIDHFAEMGIPVMRVFAGNPQRGVRTEDAMNNVVANLTEALAHAESRGILLGIENHDFITNLDRLLEILSRIDSKWLGVTFDSGNLARTSDPYGDLARIAPYAVSAQMKTTVRVDGEHQPADFGKLVEILRDANYRGYIILEYEGREDPLTAVPRYLKEIEAAIAKSG